MAECCAKLKNIKNACKGDRKTGTTIRKAYVACEDDVDDIPAAVNHVISSNIEMVDDATFYQWDIDEVGSTWAITTEGEGQAKEYLFTGVYQIAGVAPAETDSIDGLIRGTPIFMQKDANDHIMLIGDKDNGANVAVGAGNSPNRYSITVTWRGSHMPYFYTGAIPLVED